ncbi:MAG: restriction endonuclease subunit M, partial [Chlorobi bacterium]|nr:restriction endonuclease subunit M [Chlorobiota bacterium]
MEIFQKSVINKHLINLDKEQVEKAYQKFKENYNPAKIEKIKQLKEEEYQDGFLRDIFVDVLGYTLKPDDNYNLAREFKNQDDGRKADGAILNPDITTGEKAIAVIELKSTKTKDLKSITEQAFNYKNNQPDCKYVITSNFQKLRFYIDYANEFEEFDLFNLQKTDFERLYLILNTNSVFSDLPIRLKDETKFHEQEISVKLYNNYSDFKNKLFNNLVEKNPDFDKLTLFKKSQKLLDRFLFILFAEDSGLLPPNSISRIIKRYEILKEEDAYKPLYDIFKQYFGYMNIGRKGKNTNDDIPAYNGGLFYPDELLDNLKIDDEILTDDLLILSAFDFNTDIDVNILGHIFEHSLSEIEEIAAEIEATADTSGHTPLTKTSKRKKDGVFYTPKYIT